MVRWAPTSARAATILAVNAIFFHSDNGFFWIGVVCMVGLGLAFGENSGTGTADSTVAAVSKAVPHSGQKLSAWAN
ncbi:hypothetical protein [Lederbergia citrea]|uniref:hypothetical protein n=1 Tax=Lederbergia citrea TaxID=2833581 RepID=UPI00201648D9|nr:hypothetical protein [Lederbergia citrea]